MSNSTTVRNEVKQLAQQIENLAREVQVRIDNGSDPLMVANELVRNNSTFVFVLGEMYALEQSTGRTVKATPVSNPNNTSRNYHNLRDSLGRFTRKV
jgi:hypothetical protein